MKNYFAHVLVMFFAIISGNLLVGWSEGDSSFFDQPFKYFGISLLLSLVGGYVLYLIDKKGKAKKEA